MTENLKETADLLLEFLLPFPAEKSWEEVKVYLGTTDITLHLLLTEIEKDIPGLLYKSVDMHDKPVALGIREEKKPGLLGFLSDGGFRSGAEFTKA
ncbi:MAG: hypothetical protein ACTHLE_12705 [Agriterribacter sp.]